MPPFRILAVEDDESIAKLISYNLKNNGWEPKVCPSGETGLEEAKRNTFDLILLDVMLPGIDGYEVCRQVRRTEKNARTPVIFLSARGEEVDKVVGFELGADDYITKPFSPRELILRIKAILGRKNHDSNGGEMADTVQIDRIRIDIPRHQVSVEDKPVALTLMEFKLLLTLIRRKGRVQTREVLLNDVWGIDKDIYSRTVDTHIRNLRRKMGKMGDHIETIRGVGYRFQETV